MKIAYVGIDLFYPAMKALIDEGCEIIKLFTCETDNITEFNHQVISLAKLNHIPYTQLRIRKEDIAQLKSQGCEALICAGYYYLIPVDDQLPMVNIHPSLLPSGRGSWPMPITILREIPVSGVTFHKMSKAFDTGDIILQKSFSVAKDDTLESFMDHIYQLLPDIIKTLVNNFHALYSAARPQGEGEYWPAPSTEDWTITTDMAAEMADRILRAFYGYDCIYKMADKSYRLLRGRYAAYDDSEGHFLPFKDGYIRAEWIEEL